MSKSKTSGESSLLLTLAEISQLVAHSHDIAETLRNIVQLLGGRFSTEVCSVYLLEPSSRELVLAATVGLDSAGIGIVRMKPSEGLVGLVVERIAPVMEQEAFQHPRFKYFPEAGEDRYHSFLGVPVVERGLIQGVLVLQTIEPRPFTHDEVRMLVTVASQLAPLVGSAQFLKQVTSPEKTSAEPDPANRSFSGIPLSPGEGTGIAYFTAGFKELANRSSETNRGNPEEEKQRTLAALESAKKEVASLVERISDLLGEDQGVILQGQLLLLQDRQIELEILSKLAPGVSAERAVSLTLDHYIGVFERISNPYFRERVYDLKDVFRRILFHLSLAPIEGDHPQTRLVLLSEEASVMDLFSFAPERLAGIVVEHGGWQTHAAILARSLSIPMLGGIDVNRAKIKPGSLIRVDGNSGILDLDPQGPSEIRVISKPDECQKEHCGLPLPSHAPRIEANLNLPCEVSTAVAVGAQGIGLFRSEFLFLARRTLPSEQEQVEIYRKLIRALNGRPISIRTFDLRPDKLAHWSEAGEIKQGRLDWRLVLQTPPLQQLFYEQVRSILRAAAEGPTRLVIPFVNSSEQLDFILESLDRARENLDLEGLPFNPDVTLGIMVESAAATGMIKTWAPQVDFFALGTNDLVASSLGLDRDDAATECLHDPLHPGVLRLIHNAVVAAHYAGKEVTVCGEVSGDACGAQVLAALQVDAISVPVDRMVKIRNAVARHCLENPDPEQLTPLLLRLRTAREVRELLVNRQIEHRQPA